MNILFQIQLGFQAPGQAAKQQWRVITSDAIAPLSSEHSNHRSTFSVKSSWKPLAEAERDNARGRQGERFYSTTSPATLWNEEWTLKSRLSVGDADYAEITFLRRAFDNVTEAQIGQIASICLLH